MPDRTASGPAEVPPRTREKRAAIQDAARDLFLRDGFVTTTMDEVAARACVSKQTVYKHFSDKAELFKTIVLAEIAAAEQETHTLLEDLPDRNDFAEALRDFARQHLVGVLKPSLLALRRTIIGEATRFPDLARTWWEHGPQAGHETLARVFQRAADQGHLRLDDPMMAGQQFNWLVLSIPLNAALLLGEEAGFTEKDLHALADEAVRVFLAAYGP